VNELFGRGGLLTARSALVTKRKAYFAFHYDDIMRVNNVRNAWKIDHPESVFARSFYDSSLWESKKLEGDEAVKTLIRTGVQYTSAVCVLIGADTWSRRWVKYEIARAGVDGRGLLAVHINGLNHHKRKTPDPLGLNPLSLLGIYSHSNRQYYLYEKKLVPLNWLTGQRQWEWQWKSYTDYTFPVKLPPYLSSPSVGYIMPLSSGTRKYDFATDQGHRNIGKWIHDAAISVGR
jgi:antiphage defense system Thoeris ThsB-like protein